MKNKSGVVVLDTSALIAYLADETGGDLVRKILENADKGTVRVLVSFISLTELYYVCFRRRGAAAARELVVLVKALPVEFVYPDERMALSAGRIKASGSLSLADALIAATAIDNGAGLCHKDPEFESLSDHIDLMTLPYRNRAQA